MDGEGDLPADPSAAARRSRDRRAARRLARTAREPCRPARARPRAYRRQSVLRRGGGTVARRSGQPGRDSGRPPAGAAFDLAAGSADRASTARRADRSLARRQPARAASGRGDRQALPGIDPAARRRGIEEPAESARLRIEASIGLVRAADYDLVDGPEMESAFEEGGRLAIETGDLDARVRVLLAYSAQVLNTGAFERSEQLLAEAEEAADASGDVNLRFVVRGHAGFICVLRGEQLRALERYEEAFALLGDRVPTDGFFLRRY